MNNITLQQLKDSIKDNDKSKILLCEWFKDNHLERFTTISTSNGYNWGAVVESAIKQLIHYKNKKFECNKNPDLIINGIPVEIKYITIRTSCGIGSKEHHKNKHLIVFNNGRTIEIKECNFNELEINQYNKLTYQKNCNKGKTLMIYKKGIEKCPWKE